MAIFNPQRAQALREQRGFTREQFATDIGRAYGTVVKIDRGEIRPSITTLGEMARVLGCRVSDFFDDDEPDLLADDDPRPSDLGVDVDQWVKVTLARMPPMTPDVARRVSAVMFPATSPSRVRAPRRRAS